MEQNSFVYLLSAYLVCNVGKYDQDFSNLAEFLHVKLYKTRQDFWYLLVIDCWEIELKIVGTIIIIASID